MANKRKTVTDTRKCKIRIIKEILGIYPRYQPKIGKVYFAEYIESTTRAVRKAAPICVINMADKRVIVRKDEFEIVG